MRNEAAKHQKLKMGQAESTDGGRWREESESVPSPVRTFPEEFTTRFEVLEEIGKGAFGLVYKVRDLKTKAIYATKHLEYNESNTKEVSYKLSYVFVSVDSAPLVYK